MTQKLQELIYQYNGTIVVQGKTVEDVFKEIESVRNASSLEGFIFRPNFASSVEFNEYTDEDYYAIYAQWSITFGWSGLFELFTNDNPVGVLDRYFASRKFDSLEPLITEEVVPTVKSKDYLFELANSLASSKSVLTSHQKDILKNMPVEVLKSVYETDNISIRETRTIIVSEIMKQDGDFNPFKSIADIIPILIENYSIKDTFLLPEGKALNKTFLKQVKIKLPTSIKRKIIKTLILGYKTKAGIENIKKYQDFWKKVLRQSLIKNSFDKTVKDYPEFKEIHKLVYSNISTDRTVIEAFRKNGMLAEAFKIEMKNPGSMVRNILFYLRNKVGDTYPTKISNKVKERMNTIEIKTGIPVQEKGKVKVKTDISVILDSEEFYNVLVNTNSKLLLQLKSLLKDKRNYEDRTSKKMNNVVVSYEDKVPGIKKSFAKKVLKLVDKAYKEVKHKENSYLGKVFISKELKDIKVNFSGRLDVSTNKSGEFLPIGSKIKIEDLLKDDVLVRYGVSWKSPENNKDLSICIDPSLNITNGEFEDMIVNWQSPELFKENDIVVSSSGDITSCSFTTCSFNEWSTELMDIDINKMRKAGSTKMFTTIINYHAPTGSLSEVETHVFVNIINKKNRIVQGRTVSIPLDKMDYSYQVMNDTQAEIGLKIDLEEGTIQVLKLAFNDIPTNSNANKYHEEFKKAIKDMPKLPSAYKALKGAINPSQIVKKKEEADIVLDKDFDNIELQKILF